MHWLSEVSRMKVLLVVVFAYVFVTADAAEEEEYKSVLKRLLSKMNTVHSRRAQQPNKTQASDQVQEDHREEFGDWKKSMMFPGGDYIFKILEQYTNWVPAVANITDHVTLKDWSFITDNLSEIWATLHDPESVALYYSRILVQRVVHQRAACPTAIFDRFIARSLFEELERMMHEKELSMKSFIKELLDRIAAVGPSNATYSSSELAAQITRDVHGMLFNDFIEYFLSSSYMDVAVLAHTTYSRLRLFFMPFMTIKLLSNTTISDVARIMDEIVTAAPVQCPSRDTMVARHTLATQDFVRRVEYLEKEIICRGTEYYLKHHIPFTVDESTLMGVVSDMCTLLHTYISAAAYNVQQYETMITTGQTDYMEYFKHILPEDEFQVLKAVLNILDWHYVPDWIIPALTVVQNEQSDIDLWQSFIDGITEENIGDMEYEDFTTFVNQWLQAKNERLKLYKSYKVD